MRFDVVAREGVPPASAGRQQFVSTSGDERWTLRISGSMEMRMGGPWRGHGTLRGPDDTTDLGEIGFPFCDFVPWLSGDHAVWLDRKARPLLVPLADPSRASRMSSIKGEMMSVVCNGNRGVALRMYGWRHRALTFFNSAGETTGEWQHRNLFGAAGFTEDGAAVLAMVQAGWKGTVELVALDPESGDVLVQIGLDEIDPFDPGPDRSGGLPLTRADLNGAYGTWRRDHPIARFDAERGVLFVGREHPTGEKVERFGKPHAVSELHWIQIALTS